MLSFVTRSGWPATLVTIPGQLPRCRLEKGEHWVEVHGEIGCDEQTLLDRAERAAHEIDLLGAADGEH
jgi:hypothetical protein